jgi:hypothetical protein
VDAGVMLGADDILYAMDGVTKTLDTFFKK